MTFRNDDQGGFSIILSIKTKPTIVYGHGELLESLHGGGLQIGRRQSFALHAVLGQLHGAAHGREHGLEHGLAVRGRLFDGLGLDGQIEVGDLDVPVLGHERVPGHVHGDTAQVALHHFDRPFLRLAEVVKGLWRGWDDGLLLLDTSWFIIIIGEGWVARQKARPTGYTLVMHAG